MNDLCFCHEHAVEVLPLVLHEGRRVRASAQREAGASSARVHQAVRRVPFAVDRSARQWPYQRGHADHRFTALVGMDSGGVHDLDRWFALLFARWSLGSRCITVVRDDGPDGRDVGARQRHFASERVASRRLGHPLRRGTRRSGRFDSATRALLAGAQAHEAMLEVRQRVLRTLPDRNRPEGSVHSSSSSLRASCSSSPYSPWPCCIAMAFSSSTISKSGSAIRSGAKGLWRRRSERCSCRSS